MPAGLAALCGLAALALAVTLDDAALPTLITAVTAAAGLLAFAAFVEPEARLRLISFASAAFSLGLAWRLVRTARKRALAWPLAALFGVALATSFGLRGLSRARLARSDDRRLHDLSRHFDHRRAAHRRSKLAAPARRRRPVDHPGLFLGAGACSGPRAGGYEPDVSRDLHLRAHRPLCRAGRAGAVDTGARSRASRRACRRPATGDCSRSRRRRRVPRFSGRVRRRRARHARCWRARSGGLRAKARRAARALARAAEGP